jgi:hypothetical protein
MNDLFAPIIAIIIANFSADYPPATLLPTPTNYPIFQGYQNNWVMPQNGKCVVITKLYSDNLILNPRSIPNVTTETQEFITVVSTTFEIDFYGQNSDNNANVFELLLNSNYANDFFIINNFACRVNKVEKVRNLTDIAGRDMYLPRHTFKFSLINNIRSTVPLSTYDDFNNKIYPVFPEGD